jgi:DNA (cytosine-5)-methyltransferase 1
MSGFKFIDLFAGIGGTRNAFQQLGGECVFSCEIDEEAREVYERNYDEPVTEYDIRDFEARVVPNHDVLLACWPCPSFSQMGKKGGFEDERGQLFFEVTDILEEKQPKAFLMENVKNLKFVKDGAAFETVKGHLRDAGYEVHWTVLNALDFGLPQHRERLIIVGFREDIAPEDFEIPTETAAALTTEDEQRAALAGILEDDPDERYTASEKVQSDRIESVPDAPDVPSPSVWHENRNGGVTPQPYSGTLRASSSWNYLLVDGKRHFTVREMLNLQGFPKNFELDDSSRSRARRLTGNTVPVPMILSSAEEILSTIIGE